MAKGFFRRRDDWLREMLADERITADQRRVAALWALGFVNCETEDSFAAMATVAGRAGSHRKTAQRAFRTLVRLGYAVTFWETGRRTPTYRMLFDRQRRAAVVDDAARRRQADMVSARVRQLARSLRTDAAARRSP